jgi:L-aspartate oxidase
VFGEGAAKDILASWADLPRPPPIRGWDESRVTDSDEEVVIHQIWGEIRRFMWNFVGIVRTTKRLERAKRRIDMIRQEVTEYYKNFRVTPDLIELRNLVEVADLIIRSALSRHESRGLHYTLDYPDLLPKPVDTVLVP